MPAEDVRQAQTAWGLALGETASAEGKLNRLIEDRDQLQAKIDSQEKFVVAAHRAEAEVKEFLARAMASGTAAARQERERQERVAALEAAQQRQFDAEQAFARAKAEREAARTERAVAEALASVSSEGEE